MKNKTVYSYELLLKVNIAYTRKARRNALIYFLITFVAGVGLILGCIFENCLTSMTMYVGVFFLALSYTSFRAFLFSRKSKIQKSVKLNIDENPNKILEYQFEDDYITIIQTSKYVQSETRIAYSYITTTVKNDNNSFYFVTKNNLFYVLEDEHSIDECFSYLCNKIKEFS